MGLDFRIDRSTVLGLLASLCWLSMGMGQANFGNLTSFPTFLMHFPSFDTGQPGMSADEKAHKSLLLGVVTSVYEIGLAFGGLSIYYFGDILGRKKMTYVAAVVVIAGTVIEASAYDLAQLYIGRVVAGLGIGAFTATVPAWVTESVPPKKRGALVLLNGAVAIVGIALASWILVGVYVHQREREISWRLPLALQGVVALIVIAGVVFLDESPRILVRKGRREEAYKIMKKNRGKDLLNLDEEYQEMIQAFEREIATKDKSPWSFNKHKQFYRTFTAITISGLTQMAGINLITFYGSRIFSSLGLSHTKSHVALAGLQTWQAIWAFVAMYLVGRYGRRKLILGSSATMAVCFCCCAGLDSSDNDSARYAILAFDAIQLLAFPIGLFLNPFLINSEIAGLLCRSAVLACSSFSHWILNFVLALVTPLGFDQIGYRYYIIYAVTNAATFAFSYFFVPETSGLTVEEIDEAYVSAPTIFGVVKAAENLRSGRRDAQVPSDESLSAESFEKGSVMVIENVEKSKGSGFQPPARKWDNWLKASLFSRGSHSS